MDKIRYFANKPSAVLVPEESTFTELSVTENGEYTPEGYDGFSFVKVEVPQTTLGTLNATENRTYTAPEGTAYDEVVVNVVPDLVTKTITANGVYTASSDNADGFSSVNVSVSSDELPTLYMPSLSSGDLSTPLKYSAGSSCGSFPKKAILRINDVSWEETILNAGDTFVTWIYDKTPIAGGITTIYGKNVAPKFNDSGERSRAISIPSATETTGYCSVAGLGNSNPPSATFTYDANFPRSFQEVQDTYGNYFIKIPTIYRKVLTSSDGQITSYALATSAVDTDYKPFPCFIDRTNSNAILPYILIGKYLISSTTAANSVDATATTMSITNARTLAQARGTGYQLFDWQMWELFRDLGVVISRFINISQGSSYIHSVMGVCQMSEIFRLDGFIKGSNDDSQQWYCAYDPADYYTPSSAEETEATILSHNYIKISYKSPSASGYITKLGYDPNNPFFNQPSEASGGSSSTYYCDQYEGGAGANLIDWQLGSVQSSSGWFRAYGLYTIASSRYTRLCYRPILGATGYTE